MKLNKQMSIWEVTYDCGDETSPKLTKRIRTRYQDLYVDFEEAIAGNGYIVEIKEFDIVFKRNIPRHEMERVLLALGKGLK